MSMAAMGGLGIIVLLLTLAARVPVALATAGVAIIGYLIIGLQDGISIMQTGAAIGTKLQNMLDVEAVTVVILYILLGNLAFYSGISTRVYDAAAIWLRHIPGGLAIASVLGCGGFAGLSGSSVACASTMGRICVPEMQKHGYDARLSSASVAVGGTVGAMIPPSIMFIIYGLMSEQSIEALFLAGFLPGLLSLAGMILVIIWWVREAPGVAPKASPAEFASLMIASRALISPLALIAVLFGGLASGMLSAWSVGAVCTGFAFLVGIVNHRLSIDVIWQVVRETASQAVIAIVIIASATMFLGFVNQTGAGQSFAAWVEFNGLPGLTVIAVAALIYLILGMFLEPMGILILTLPVMLPLIGVYGMDPIWFGVIAVKLLEMALITPPVGLNVFIINSVCPNIRTDRIFEGVARFLVVDVVVLAILILFPLISTILPGLIAS